MHCFLSKVSNVTVLISVTERCSKILFANLWLCCFWDHSLSVAFALWCRVPFSWTPLYVLCIKPPPLLSFLSVGLVPLAGSRAPSPTGSYSAASFCHFSYSGEASRCTCCGSAVAGKEQGTVSFCLCHRWLQHCSQTFLAPVSPSDFLSSCFAVRFYCLTRFFKKTLK